MKLAGSFVHATELAICIKCKRVTAWLPLSELPKEATDQAQNSAPGDPVEFTVPDWLARKKGLI